MEETESNPAFSIKRNKSAEMSRERERIGLNVICRGEGVGEERRGGGPVEGKNVMLFFSLLFNLREIPRMEILGWREVVENYGTHTHRHTHTYYIIKSRDPPLLPPPPSLNREARVNLQ